MLGLFLLAATLSVPIPQQTGYCVTVEALGRVDVPLHKPDPEKLDELRGSITNALHLMVNQAKVRALAANDPELYSRASALEEKLKAGPISIERERRKNDPPSNTVHCTCATLAGDPTVIGHICTGPCSNCFKC